MDFNAFEEYGNMPERFPDTLFHPVQWDRPTLPDVPDDFHILKGLERRSDREQLELLIRPFRQFHIPTSAAMSQLRGRIERLIQDALAFSKEGHLGQNRQTGEPYYTHPLQAAIWMAQHGARWQGIVSTLLHDVPEDWLKTPNRSVRTTAELPLKLILDTFGEEVAYEVYRLSSYNYRNGEMQHPWNLEYYHPETSADRDLKEKFKDALIEKKRGTLFRDPDDYRFDSEPPEVKRMLEKIREHTGIHPNYLNALDLEAIDAKGCDSVHNRQTLGVYDQQTLEKRLQKFELLALSRVLPAIDPKYSKYFPAVRLAAPYPFAVPAPSRKKLNLHVLSQLPHPEDPVINLHSEGDEHDALFSHAGFGYGRLVHDRLFRDLSHRIQALGGSVEHDSSILSPGHVNFEAFKIDQGTMTFDDLTRVLRHMYLKYAKKPFQSNAADYVVNGVHCAYLDEDRDHLVAYVPLNRYNLVADTFNRQVGSQIAQVQEFIRKGKHIVHWEFGPIRVQIPYEGSPHLMLQFGLPNYLRGEGQEHLLGQELEHLSEYLGRYRPPRSKF